MKKINMKNKRLITFAIIATILMIIPVFSATAILSDQQRIDRDFEDIIGSSNIDLYPSPAAIPHSWTVPPGCKYFPEIWQNIEGLTAFGRYKWFSAPIDDDHETAIDVKLNPDGSVNITFLKRVGLYEYEIVDQFNLSIDAGAMRVYKISDTEIVIYFLYSDHHLEIIHFVFYDDHWHMEGFP